MATKVPPPGWTAARALPSWLAVRCPAISRRSSSATSMRAEVAMPDDQLAATLDEIRGRGYRNGARGALCARLSDAAAVDAPRLLAALDAALKLAGDWGREGTDPSWQLTNEDAAVGTAGRGHSAVLRAAITAALTKGEAAP